MTGRGPSVSSHSGPSVSITIQPARIYRFRYMSEVGNDRSFGSLPGSSTDDRTYPTIRVDGYQGHFAVLLSLVNATNNLVHPHSVMGADSRYICKNGTIYVISKNPEVVFNKIGIICVLGKTREAVVGALARRQEMLVDPFRAGYEHINNYADIDLTAVRLCFQVFLPGRNWTPDKLNDPTKYTSPLRPVASTVVYDAKKHGCLKIKYISRCAGPLSGGTEMHLWCENKYTGEDPDVVFDDGCGWTEKATDTEYHKKLVMRFKAPHRDLDPEYQGPNCTDKLQVKVYLQQSSPLGVLRRSSPATVTYLPNDPKNNNLKSPPLDYLSKKRAKSKEWKQYSDKMETFDPNVTPSISSQAQQLTPSSVPSAATNEDSNSSLMDSSNNSNNEILPHSSNVNFPSTSSYSNNPSKSKVRSRSPIYYFAESMSTNSQESGLNEIRYTQDTSPPIHPDNIEFKSRALNTSEILNEVLDMESIIYGEHANVNSANVNHLLEQFFPCNGNQ